MTSRKIRMLNKLLESWIKRVADFEARGAEATYATEMLKRLLDKEPSLALVMEHEHERNKAYHMAGCVRQWKAAIEELKLVVRELA